MRGRVHPNRPKTFARKPTLPQEGPNFAIHDKGRDSPKDAPSRCPKPSPAVLTLSGRGYGPLSMRIQRPAVDMFSLSVQVVGKNVNNSSSGRASEKGVTQQKI
jgi:hypothetical protein